MSHPVTDTIAGIDTWELPSQSGTPVLVTTVLVLGTGNDVACYQGVGTPEWVALGGDKVSLRDAKRHFPGIEGYLERRGWIYRGPAE